MITRTGKKKWADLSGRQRGSIRLVAVVQIALLVAALADLRQRTSEEINGSKRLWTGVIFINIIGPLAYFRFGRRRS